MDTLGVDIAKDTFEVCLLDEEGEVVRLEKTNFVYNDRDFEKLLGQLRDPAQTRVVMEATGVYSERAVKALLEQVADVYVINPLVVKRECRSLVQTKTDTADARSNALCGHRMALLDPDSLNRFRVNLSDEALELKLLQNEHNRVRKAVALLKTQIKELGYRVAPNKDAILNMRFEELAYLEQKKKRLNREIDQRLKASTSKEAALLRSIPGIGTLTAARLLSTIGDISRFKSVDAFKANFGIYPRRWQSGQSESRSRLAKHGDKYLRFLLWNAAKCASKKNPVCTDYYNSLVSRGFTAPKAWGAIMRKLLQIVYGVLKHQTPFDPNFSRKRGALA